MAFKNSVQKPKVFIACTGVDHINRGYESFTKECFAALKDNSRFDLYMVKGGGKSTGNEIKISCIKRNSSRAALISKLIKKEPYWIEQATFFISMLPFLIRYKPAVIYYSDFILGTFLFHVRRFFKFKYKLLFSNGAPNGPPFKTEDHVQQLLPIYFEDAVKKETPANKLTLLPYGININVTDQITKLNNVISLRDKLNLPKDKKIIISVGAVNIDHKRMDYVIKEFRALDMKKYFLLILGQIDNKSFTVIQLATETLPSDSYLIKQVAGNEVSDYITVSDYFILASLKEGLPRVLPEALSNGLIPIVHDYDVTRQALKQYGVFKDLTKHNCLKIALSEVDNKDLSKEEIVKYAWETYSWEKLENQYNTMISQLLN